MYCKSIGCSNSVNWRGTVCDEHDTKSTTTKTRRKNNTVLLNHEDIAGMSVVFAPGGKNRSFNRKHVRRNGPVSYHTGFSLDMLKDMDTGRISTRRIITEPQVQTIEHKQLIATMKPTNMMNPDA